MKKTNYETTPFLSFLKKPILFLCFVNFSGVDVKKHRISATSGRKLLMQCGADSLVPSNFMAKIAGHKVENSQLEYMRKR